jgi:1-acylglycerone phosphate reductase
MVKVVLITGCSKGGIGDALAQEFYRQGLRVFATARDLAKIQHLKTMGLETLQLDVTSEESIQNAATYIKEATGGKLDFLVNNAGIGKFKSRKNSNCS